MTYLDRLAQSLVTTEHRTSNAQHPTSNGGISIYQPALWTVSQKQGANSSVFDVGRWMFDVFFITKSRKDETTKNCSKHFVLFRFRVFVIHISDQSPNTDYGFPPYCLLRTPYYSASVFRTLELPGSNLWETLWTHVPTVSRAALVHLKKTALPRVRRYRLPPGCGCFPDEG